VPGGIFARSKIKVKIQAHTGTRSAQVELSNWRVNFKCLRVSRLQGKMSRFGFFGVQKEAPAAVEFLASRHLLCQSKGSDASVKRRYLLLENTKGSRPGNSATPHAFALCKE
jgi:hypothetical protein